MDSRFVRNLARLGWGVSFGVGRGVCVCLGRRWLAPHAALVMEYNHAPRNELIPDACTYTHAYTYMQVEEVGARLQALKAEYEGAGREKLAAAEAASAAQEAAGVVSNGLVPETIHSLRTAFEELGKLLGARWEDHMQAQVRAWERGCFGGSRGI